MLKDKHASLRQVRRKHILMTLDLTTWDLEKAAKLLDLSIKELRREIKKIGSDCNETPDTD